MPSRIFSFFVLLFLINPIASAQEVQIGVLGLFHPRQITVGNAKGEAVVIRANDREFVLEDGPRTNIARIEVAGDALLLDFGGHVVHAAEIRAAGLEQSAERIDLTDIGFTRELTPRQLEVLVRLSRGERVPAVARDLYISQSTVRNHLSTIFAKAGVHSQSELMRVVLEARARRPDALAPTPQGATNA